MHHLTHASNPHPCAPAHHKAQASAAPVGAPVTACPPALAQGTGAGQGTRLAAAAARRAFYARGQ